MRVFTYLPLTLGLLGLVPQAAAQPMACNEHTVIVSALTEHYKEKRESMGLTKDGNLIEVFVSGAGSWTILMTTKEKMTCAMAAGQHWQSLPKQVTGGSGL